MRAIPAIALMIVMVSFISWGLTHAKGLEPPVPAVPSLREQLIGTYRLVERDLRRADGSTDIDPVFGPNPAGYITYEPSGHMSLQFMKRERPSNASTAGYNAYFGTFTVDEQAKTVTHHTEGNLNPRGVGQHQTRDVILNGDDLTLVVHTMQDGKPAAYLNRFSRIK